MVGPWKMAYLDNAWRPRKAGGGVLPAKRWGGKNPSKGGGNHWSPQKSMAGGGKAGPAWGAVGGGKVGPPFPPCPPGWRGREGRGKNGGAARKGPGPGGERAGLGGEKEGVLGKKSVWKGNGGKKFFNKLPIFEKKGPFLKGKRGERKK